MPYDVVRPLKLESSARGGVQNDALPRELDACADAIATPAILLQDTTTSSIDQSVAVSRTGASLVLTDKNTSHVLREIVSSSAGQVGSHNALLDVIHFLSDGPGDGWASGATNTVAYSGLLPTLSVWWSDAAQTKRIVAKAWSYTGLLLSTEKTSLYAADGVSVVISVTDTFTYSGIVRTGRTRTWSTP